MVVAVVGEAAFQSLSQAVKRCPLLCERFERCIVEVEVEFRIDLSTADIAAN